jgi:transposase
MIALQSDVRVYLACGYTDMRKGMQGLAMLVQQVLAEDPFNGALYAFRGRRGDLLKLIWHDGIGLCMLSKRLERGHFIWPMTSTRARSHCRQGSCRRCSKGASGGRRRATCGPSWQADL